MSRDIIVTENKYVLSGALRPELLQHLTSGTVHGAQAWQHRMVTSIRPRTCKCALPGLLWRLNLFGRRKHQEPPKDCCQARSLRVIVCCWATFNGSMSWRQRSEVRGDRDGRHIIQDVQQDGSLCAFPSTFLESFHRWGARSRNMPFIA